MQCYMIHVDCSSLVHAYTQIDIWGKLHIYTCMQQVRIWGQITYTHIYFGHKLHIQTHVFWGQIKVRAKSAHGIKSTGDTPPTANLEWQAQTTKCWNISLFKSALANSRSVICPDVSATPLSAISPNPSLVGLAHPPPLASVC